MRSRLARNIARRPSGLEVVSPGDAVDVEHFPGEEQARNGPGLHALKIHLDT